MRQGRRGASWARLGAGVALALAGFAAACPASADAPLRWTTVHDTARSALAQPGDGAPLTVEVRCPQGRAEVRLRHPRLGEIAREREDRRPGWLRDRPGDDRVGPRRRQPPAPRSDHVLVPVQGRDGVPRRT